MRATAAGLVRTNHSILTFLFELAYRVWSRLFFQPAKCTVMGSQHMQANVHSGRS